MRNCIPEVAEAAVIEDFYRGSNDSAFVRAILQKAPTTSEQLFREADLYITVDERAQDLIGGAKPAPAAPRRDTNQQPDKRWEKRPREEVHAAGPPASRARGGPRGGEHTLDDILDAECPYHKDMRHTLRNCRDFKHSVGNGRPLCRRFEPGGSLDRRVNCCRVPQPRWVGARRSAKGGRSRRETGVRGETRGLRVCPAPRSGALAVGGYKRPRGRERAASRERRPVLSRAANPL
jgi:hypothetical protein